jgi:hypothetical protein
MADLVFHRQPLAAQIADKLLQTDGITAAGSGLFLAGQRRMGKSTFLREDLRPELMRRGAIVIYVDLWDDIAEDPAKVIMAAVRQTLALSGGVVKRLAKASGVEKVTVGGALSFALDRVGLGGDVSLSTALAALSDETRRMIAFVIDEAQHALTSEAGVQALFALKAARDELNSSQHHGLRILATGSNRDKLAMMRNGKDQPFYLAPLIAFPPLGGDYVQWFCDNAKLAGPLDTKKVAMLFERAGFRPEILAAALDNVRFDFTVTPKNTAARFALEVERQLAVAHSEMLKAVHSLPPLQRAVLEVMAQQGDQYAPFEPATLQKYKDILDRREATTKVSAENVQAALRGLQERKLVWRASRGVYALEEPALVPLIAAEARG